MKNIIFVLCASVFIAPSYASPENNGGNISELIGQGCLKMISKRLKTNKDELLTMEAFIQKVTPLKPNVIMLDLIFIASSGSDYLTKQEQSGLCEADPVKKTVSWKPFTKVTKLH